jgi:hypothetical protein
MSREDRDRAVDFITAAHPHLAEYAQRCYASDGRGAIQVSVPELQPGVASGVVKTDMVYHAQAELRQLFANLTGDERADADVLLTMVDTYDPVRQAVVIAAVAGGAPLTVKIKLDLPVVVDEAKGIH